jgi:DNA-directed RNA polymerase subunit RPC12/RpoP
MSITLVDIVCLNCNNIVWYNNGNMDDQTSWDVDVIQCPYCLEKVFTESYDPGDIIDIPLTEIDMGYKTAIGALTGND